MKTGIYQTRYGLGVWRMCEVIGASKFEQAGGNALMQSAGRHQAAASAARRRL